MTIHDDVRTKIFEIFNLKDICGELDNCLKMKYTINNKEVSFTDGVDEYGNDIIGLSVVNHAEELGAKELEDE